MTFGMTSIVATVVVAHFLALISPGPDFLLVVRSSLRNSRWNAIGVAAGISAANGVYISLCIVGVASVLATSLIVMTLLKIFGGLFLLYVAYQALRSRKSDYAFVSEARMQSGENVPGSFAREFVVGFVSGISNPKNIIFYLSLFSVVLTNEVGTAFKIALGIWMTSLVFLWDAFIVLALTRHRVRIAFGRIAFYLDKIAGTVLGAFGIGLIESAVLDEGSGST